MTPYEFRQFLEDSQILPSDTIVMFSFDPERGNDPHDDTNLYFVSAIADWNGFKLKITPIGCGTIWDLVEEIDIIDVDDMAVTLNEQSYVLADSCYFGYAEDIGHHYVLFSYEEADPDLAGNGEVLYVK